MKRWERRRNDGGAEANLERERVIKDLERKTRRRKEKRETWGRGEEKVRREER